MTVDLSAGLSVDEYLDRSFDPECELLGGETRPKPLGTGTHSRMEKRLTRLLEQFYGERRIQFELSMIVGNDILIPDVIVLASDSRITYRDILNEPPLLCVEVLSLSQRAEEMLAVPFCWVLNPVEHRAWEYHRDQPGAVEITEMFSAPCNLRLHDFFSEC